MTTPLKGHTGLLRAPGIREANNGVCVCVCVSGLGSPQGHFDVSNPFYYFGGGLPISLSVRFQFCPLKLVVLAESQRVLVVVLLLLVTSFIS